jgi:uncharacterized RDD family membrane protein YckC
MSPAYVGSSAAAPALQYEMSDRAALGRAPMATEVAPAQARKPITYQPSLFSSREVPRVVPFESISPSAAPAPTRRVTSVAHRPRRRRVVAGQQSLEFSPASRLAEGAIYCDSPVAIPAHRVTAAALDGSLIVMALAAFELVFRFFGGEVILSGKTLPMYLGVVAGVLLLYKLLWGLSNGDTPGMRWARLTLVNFDGQRPTRTQRLMRGAFGVLSLLAGGLGLLWTLVDEETLTWHDHISKTFPTPR